MVETSRYILLNEGTISLGGLVYTGIVTVLVFLVGLVIFNRTEKSFIDTV